MFLAQCLQFTDYRTPKVTGSYSRLNIGICIRSRSRNQFHHRSRVFGRSRSSYLFRLFCLRLISFGYRSSRSSGLCFTRKLKRNFCRRQTTLIVAGSIFQITFYRISPTSQLHFLHEFGSILEIAHFHFEQFVESSYFLADRLQFTYQFYTGLLLHIKCGRNRSSVSKIGRINMPPFVNGSRKHDLRFCIRKRVQFCFKLYRIFNLRLQCIGYKA